jgi:hypothetical protein
MKEHLKNNILEVLINGITEPEEFEKKYTFFNQNDFQKRFKNLLAFSCLLGAIGEKYSDINIKEVDYEYILEKYSRCITNEIVSEDEKVKVIKFAKIINKLHEPDTLIGKWEEVFGKNSFHSISTEPNYRNGCLHVLIKQNIFDVYMNNLFNKSRRYKIWRILN